MSSEGVKPITPSQAMRQKQSTLPAAVLLVFNQVIVETFNGTSASFKADRIVKEICIQMGIKSEDVYKRHYLDVEEVYRRAGWEVTYDQPGFNETYPATFTFTRKKGAP